MCAKWSLNSKKFWLPCGMYTLNSKNTRGRGLWLFTQLRQLTKKHFGWLWLCIHKYNTSLQKDQRPVFQLVLSDLFWSFYAISGLKRLGQRNGTKNCLMGACDCAHHHDILPYKAQECYKECTQKYQECLWLYTRTTLSS